MVSARRIDQFMQLALVANNHEQGTFGQPAIITEKASFSWKHQPCRFDLDVKINHGTLLGVSGAVGAGKPSLLAAILGEMKTIDEGLHQPT